MIRGLYKYCLVTILIFFLIGMGLFVKADSNFVVSAPVSQSFSNSHETSFLMDSCTMNMLGQRESGFSQQRVRHLFEQGFTRLFRSVLGILIFYLFCPAIYWTIYLFLRQPADIFSNFIILRYIHSLDGLKS